MRSHKLKHPLPISEKIQKKVEIILKELNIPEKLTPSLRVEQSYDSLRNSLIILTSLKKNCDKKEREKNKLNQTLVEYQNKNKNSSASNIIPIPHNLQDHDMLSISSSGIEKSKKSTSIKPNIKVNFFFISA